MPDTANNHARELAAFAEAASQFAQGTLAPDAFRALRVKWGVYEQRQRGTFMVRVRCTGGAVAPSRLAALAAIAHEFHTAPLHLTTRQDIQLHGVPLSDLVPLLHRLRDAGMSTYGGGGNTVGNIVVSEDSGIAVDEVFDVMPYAVETFSHLSHGTAWLDLPRKFKIAFANSDRDALRAHTTDLGFVARMQGDGRGFAVYVAGGMGARPHSGHLLHEFVPATEASAIAEALVQLFHRHGDRTNRNNARLRFLWQTLGEDAFRANYQEERDRIVRPQSNNQISNVKSQISNTPPSPIPSSIQHPASSILLPLPSGRLAHDDARALAELLQPFGDDTIRCTCEQNFLLRNIPDKRLKEVRATLAARFPLMNAPRIVGTAIACTGAGSCPFGACRTQDALRAVQESLLRSDLDLDATDSPHTSDDADMEGHAPSWPNPSDAITPQQDVIPSGKHTDATERVPPSSRRNCDLRIALSGCPNACGRHLVADIGFCGRKRERDGVSYPAYGVFVGATLTSTGARFAREVGEVPAHALPACLDDILRHWLAHQRHHASFAAYIEADGAADIADICARHAVVPPHDIAPDYYRDWGVS